MDNSSLVISLALVTLIMVLALLLWQRYKVGKAKSEHHHSALTEGHPEQRSTDGAPGVKPQ